MCAFNVHAQSSGQSGDRYWIRSEKFLSFFNQTYNEIYLTKEGDAQFVIPFVAVSNTTQYELQEEVKAALSQLNFEYDFVQFFYLTYDTSTWINNGHPGELTLTIKPNPASYSRTFELFGIGNNTVRLFQN